MLTLYFSDEGIEDYDAAQVEKLFTDIGYYRPREGFESKGTDSLMKFTDGQGNEFFSFNVAVGVEDEPARITGAIIYPFSILNEFNSENQ